MKLSEILTERGYVYQQSGASLEEITDGPKRTLYLGIDPTADSMHVGHLQAMLVLRRFIEDGHKVIVLLGGGTGMIGDPSGKSEERILLNEETLAHNAAGVKKQASKLFKSESFQIQNNLDWLGKLKVIDFLRDIGKHFSVNAMMSRDSVKDRLENREQGISYTEFSYMLLQSYDFLHLFENESCDLQVGASDQWGNMVSGVDLIRRKTGKTAYAFSFPLLVNKATGKKFGKSEGGAVWLDANKTSAFDFYQFWFNTDDADVEEYLLKMTMLPKADIDAVMAEQKENPAARSAQKNLAFEVTALVHGEDEAEKVAKAAEDLFSGGGSDNAPTVKVEATISLVDALVQSNLAASKREARQFISDGAVQLNGEKISDESRTLSKEDFKEGKAILKRGKRNIVALTL
jgi:tyrosyl-tRNA synthetase